MTHFVFIYPQIKRLTGAQRLILALAGALTALPQAPRVTILTHRFAEECRPALSPLVGLIETGRNLNLTGNHYLDSLLEYGAGPSLLRYLPPDVTGLCFFGPPSLPGLWWARKIRRLKIPLLYFCYEPPRAAYTDRATVSRSMGKLGWIFGPLLWLYRPLDRYLTRQASAVLVNGEYGRQLIRETYGLESTIITHGAELPSADDAELAAQVARLRERYGWHERPIILTVNHLHPRKRIDLLIRAMPAVLEKYPAALAVIVGQGAAEAELRQLVGQLGLDKNLFFAGFVPEAELPTMYAAANIYAHLGRAESFGLAVLEASTAGLPVVAVNEGGPREILRDGETGFLVEAVPSAVADKLNYLLAHPAESRQMGQTGATRARLRYTWEQGAKDFLAVMPPA